MPYEVCYRALLSISVVEGLKLHTTLRPAAARRRAAASTTPYLSNAYACGNHVVLLGILGVFSKLTRMRLTSEVRG